MAHILDGLNRGLRLHHLGCLYHIRTEAWPLSEAKAKASVVSTLPTLNLTRGMPKAMLCKL